MQPISRDLSLDLLRILACLMVIMMHAPMPAELTAATPVGTFLASLTYLTAPCIGLFFMVSGALLLPVKAGETTFSFLRKRLGKVVAPTLIWTAFYIAVNISGGGQFRNQNNSLHSLLPARPRCVVVYVHPRGTLPPRPLAEPLP